MATNVKVKFTTTPTAVKPKLATDGAAGFDLSITEDALLNSGVVSIVGTGVSVEIPNGYEGQVRLRSSLGKKGVIITNAPGTVDSDYRGEVKLLLSTVTDYPIELKAGDRVAQLVICPIPRIELEEVEELTPTDRGTGGFGSTGK